MPEARNIHYRLLKNLPVKGWDAPERLDEDLIEDFLNCQDLANEFIAGDQESVDNLTLALHGLKLQQHGFDFRLSTDSEGHFSAVSWQTGRMRARARMHGFVLFIDVSKSGISTTGMCFWHIVIANKSNKELTVLLE